MKYFTLLLRGCYTSSLLLGVSTLALGQSQQPSLDRWATPTRQWYLGIEGIILANQATQLTTSSTSLQAGDKFLEPRPALVVGYQLTPRLGLEICLQSLPVSTGFTYARTSGASYTGFGATYTSEYFYVPVKAVVQLLGVGHRVGLSVVAGGALAWQGPQGSLPISPNYSSTSTVTNPDGSTSITSSYTQRQVQEQTAFVALEAGLRGTWRLAPRLSLDLTVRQLWGLGGSVRDLALSVSTPGEQATATLHTPVRGIMTGLGVRYAL